MKTKAQYEPANGNYWVGCRGTINKGRSVRAGAVGAALFPGLGAVRLAFSSPASPGLPEGRQKSSSLGRLGPAISMPILNQHSTIQEAFIEHLLGPRHCVFHT